MSNSRMLILLSLVSSNDHGPGPCRPPLQGRAPAQVLSRHARGWGPRPGPIRPGSGLSPAACNQQRVRIGRIKHIFSAASPLGLLGGRAVARWQDGPRAGRSHPPEHTGARAGAVPRGLDTRRRMEEGRAHKYPTGGGLGKGSLRARRLRVQARTSRLRRPNRTVPMAHKDPPSARA